MLQGLKSEIMAKPKTLAGILGSIVTVVMVAQLKWMHATGNYQSLLSKIFIPTISGWQAKGNSSCRKLMK